MSKASLLRKVFESFKTEINPERKIRIAHLLQQYSMNATRSCLKEIVCYIPLGVIISEDRVDKLMINGRPPTFKELAYFFINDELLSKLSE